MRQHIRRLIRRFNKENKEYHILVLCGVKSPDIFTKQVVSTLFPSDSIITYHLIGLESNCPVDLSRENWIDRVCDGRRIRDFTFDLVVSEFCPIHNIPDDSQSVFNVATIRQVAKIVKENAYLVVPFTHGDKYLFDVDFGDYVITIPSNLSQYQQALKNCRYHASFIPIQTIANYIKKCSAGSSTCQLRKQQMMPHT